MKNITLQLYSFDELSEEVQKSIIEKERWNVMYQCMDCYSHDYKSALNAFMKLTDTSLANWSVDYCGYSFNEQYKDSPIMECPVDYDKDIYSDALCGKLLFRYVDRNIMPYITKGKYYSTGGKYIDGKYHYSKRHSRVLMEISCPLTGMCYDMYLLDPLLKYYEKWTTYSASFSLEDLISECYDNFFKTWREEYEYWADNEDAIREELHHNQYEDRLYFADGSVYTGPIE